MHSHEGAGTTLLGALFPQASHLARGLIHTVVLEHGELNLLVLVLDLLGLGVGLLLTLLATTKEVDVAAKKHQSGQSEHIVCLWVYCCCSYSRKLGVLLTGQE